MCEYCHKSICPSGCPNASEPPKFGKCEVCKTTIYDGDEYYHIGEHIFCEACVSGGYRTAEVLDEEEDYFYED